MKGEIEPIVMQCMKGQLEGICKEGSRGYKCIYARNLKCIELEGIRDTHMH